MYSFINVLRLFIISINLGFDNCFSKNKEVMKVVGKKHYKQYTLKDVLGTGAFGRVYHSPPYAIK